MDGMDGIYDIKSTAAYKNLISLQADNSIDSETFAKHLSKLSKLHSYLMNYMKTENVLVTQLNQIKEENTRTLNENAILQKKQEEYTTKINAMNEECRKAKAELSEYENTRLLTKQFEIERLTEQISRTKEQIDNSEKEQLEILREQIKKLENEIEKSNTEFNNLFLYNPQNYHYINTVLIHSYFYIITV